MLTELRVENLGIIESVDIVLREGLIALTGETGAGKTLLVEAINLLIGERADPSRVRSGTTEARVEGRFVLDDQECVVVRVVPADGRSRAYINGRLATVGELAELGSRLVDLHGQHAHQSLLAPAVQRAALDSYAGTDLTALRFARSTIADIHASLASLGGDSRARLREIELLAYQAEEIGRAQIQSPTEDEALAVEEAGLADVVSLREAAQSAYGALTMEGGAVDALGGAVSALAPFERFADLHERLVSIQDELADVSRDVRLRSDALEEDPERLSSIRERRHLLRELRRKYGETLGEVLEFHAECVQRLEELESHESRVHELERQLAETVEEERRCAAVVAATRRAAAAQLGSDITAHLPDLAMPRAVVDVVVGGDGPADDISMMISSNPGSPLAPLSKVASGGELARTMLAIRLVLSQGPPILIFDEVDAGIGGSAANALAQSLENLGRTHQVLVVTHLAQVAAAAKQHIVISKQVRQIGDVESTVTMARSASGDDRIDEIARMLSGHPDSARARDHASELLGSWATRT